MQLQCVEQQKPTTEPLYGTQSSQGQHAICLPSSKKQQWSHYMLLRVVGLAQTIVFQWLRADLEDLVMSELDLYFCQTRFGPWLFDGLEADLEYLVVPMLDLYSQLNWVWNIVVHQLRTQLGRLGHARDVILIVKLDLDHSCIMAQEPTQKTWPCLSWNHTLSQIGFRLHLFDGL